MSRPLKIEHAGGWSHLTARGNERRAIYRDNRDRAHFRELLGQMVERMGWGKGDRQEPRVGATRAPDLGPVKERLGRLRRYRWSSYPAYVGWAQRPEWLACERVLEWGDEPAG